MRAFIMGMSVIALTTGWAEAQGVQVGLGAGYVDPADIGRTVWFTGNVRFKVAEKVTIEPEVGYWQKTESVPGLLDAEVKDLNIGANVLYLIPKGDSLKFAVGAGIGVHFLHGSVGGFGFDASESDTKFGGQLLAGLDFKVAGSVAIFAIARYDLVSDVNQVKLYGGLRFSL